MFDFVVTIFWICYFCLCFGLLFKTEETISKLKVENAKLEVEQEKIIKRCGEMLDRKS